MTLDDIERIDPGLCPMVAFANGYTSIFGLLVALRTGFWTHAMILRNPREFATQWWWYRTDPVRKFSRHSLKLAYDPAWTAEQRATMLSAIDAALAKSKWATRYDVPGLIGESLGCPEWNTSRWICSEAVASIVATADPAMRKHLEENPIPTPEELNDWQKAQKWTTWGRVDPD